MPKLTATQDDATSRKARARNEKMCLDVAIMSVKQSIMFAIQESVSYQEVLFRIVKLSVYIYEIDDKSS